MRLRREGRPPWSASACDVITNLGGRDGWALDCRSRRRVGSARQPASRSCCGRKRALPVDRGTSPPVLLAFVHLSSDASAGRVTPLPARATALGACWVACTRRRQALERQLVQRRCGCVRRRAWMTLSRAEPSCCYACRCGCSVVVGRSARAGPRGEQDAGPGPRWWWPAHLPADEGSTSDCPKERQSVCALLRRLQERR